MAKAKKTISDVIENAGGSLNIPVEKHSEPQENINTAATSYTGARAGKKSVAGHFDMIVSYQLKQLAASRNSSLQDLLGEALNDLFKKYGLPPVA